MSTDIGFGERFLSLRDGRNLAYAEAGNLHSKTIVLYLHGFFTVGDASQTSPVLLSKNVHFITPTLPGWGNTSPPTPSTLYHDCLTSDMTTLLSHLYPDSNGSDIKLYIAGGSFGTVPAQMLYGAPYDKFPFGRCISGVLLLGAMSPFRYHKDYAKYMTWEHYFVPGPVSYYIPFNLLTHLVKSVLARKMATIEGAEAMLREILFDRMDQAEREVFARWSEEHGKIPEDTVRNMAENVVKSISKSWEGFLLTPPLLHSDWGFRPDALDEEHSRPRVLLTASKDDHMSPVAYAHYLAANYKNARIKDVDGGHLSILYHMDEVWAEFLADEP
ncbi:Alpha/Beta hydrolase protein [Suillus paluster]|uniref:Alpha/Beta hydrolase protein n=1 Tax=Suillus paluster TaxID=48578 RepID=UPI001B8606D8|nr:Alpha/Beta hydrolase protein [Suillus paluster]KAG1753900.1 Alpha/Beta hydrolase protein [Suillus paluster]